MDVSKLHLFIYLFIARDAKFEQHKIHMIELQFNDFLPTIISMQQCIKGEKQKTMQCPHFKKIHFQPVSQVSTSLQDSDEQLHPHPFESMESDIEDSIPEQGQAHFIKIENYHARAYKQNEDIDIIEEIDGIISIKMPKVLMVNEFKNNYSKMGFGNKMIILPAILEGSQENDLISVSYGHQFDDDGQICDKDHETEIGNIMTKVLEPRIYTFQNSFSSVVFLPTTREHCYCHLDEHSLKLSLPVQVAQCLNIESLFNFQSSFLHNKPSLLSKTPYRIKYFIDLKKYNFEIEKINQTTLIFILKLKGQSQPILINFCSEKEKRVFEYVCKSNYSHHPNNGRKENQSDLSFTEKSVDSLRFTVQRITILEVCDIVETFDLILFKGKNIMCKMQRFFTNSNFDHVGLLMRSISGEVLLLEATGNAGVAIYSFDSISSALQQNLYERIAIRRFIQFASSKEKAAKRIQMLQNFVREVNGKNYKFNPMYLFSSSIEKGKQSSKKLKGEQADETFFCSSLVAEALMVCGVMKRERPAYRYLPRDFGDIGGLNQSLEAGFYYSDLIILQQ